MAVELTISSSNPKRVVTFCSTHCVITGLLILPRLIFLAKLAGNLVALRALLRARASETEAVPLMDGISYKYLVEYFSLIRSKYPSKKIYSGIEQLEHHFGLETPRVVGNDDEEE